MKMKRVAKILLFDNGLIAAFDELDEQITELQSVRLLDLIGRHAEQCGCEIEGAQYQDRFRIIKRDARGYTVEPRTK